MYDAQVTRLIKPSVSCTSNNGPAHVGGDWMLGCERADQRSVSRGASGTGKGWGGGGKVLWQRNEELSKYWRVLRDIITEAS